ncbi:MAG TPA: PAC2 family protein [Actinomycetes bacterium]|jgi:proteasome assembly chaperone (PAC2) family protein|nr:PAC2 family protein [Actinomycetes bacterium]
MDHTTFLHRPALRRPVLVAAFEGWNDAGEAATTALGFVAAALDAETFARIDPEEFYDFQDTRPTVRLADGTGRVIEWPTVEFQAVRLPGSDRDFILVRGDEPNLRWRTFAQEVLEVTRAFNVEMVVTLGALLADVPHTRPVQVVGSAGDPALADKLGMATSRYEGPTGILGVLADAANRTDVPAVSLWAALPHYVQATPNPRAALALVERLRTLLSLPIDTSSLVEATEAFDATVADIVADDPELVSYVERLEATHDQEASSLENLPPEDLVAEVERFLRDHPGGSRP